MSNTVVITGVSSGIGKACATTLVENGYKIIGIARREEKLKQIKEELKDNFYPMHADICDKLSIASKIDQLPDDFKRISKLVNNAGLAQGAKHLVDTSDEEIDTMINTNIRGIINTTQVFLPYIIDSQLGHIINVTSIGANVHYPTGHVYAATKAFVEHFGKCLQTELVNNKVRLTNIAPGKTLTEFSLVQFNGDAEKAKNVYKDIQPLKPENIAEAILWSLNQPVHVNIDSIAITPAEQNLFFR